MLTKRKWISPVLLCFWLAGVLTFFTGCQPSGPRSLLKGQKYIQEGDYNRALKSLALAAELMPSHPQVWNHLGLAHHGLGQIDKAIQSYQQALKLDRNLAPARYNLGVLFLQENRLNEAVAELNTYTLLSPNSPEGWQKLGAALVQQQRPDDAERVLERALRLAPKHAESLNNLGLAHLQRKRPREAVQAFNSALQAQPGYGPALLNQAIVAQQYFGNLQVALERYKAYLATDPPEGKAAQVRQLVGQLEAHLAPRVVPPQQPETAVATKAAEPPATPAVSPEPSSKVPPAQPEPAIVARPPTNQTPPEVRSRTNMANVTPPRTSAVPLTNITAAVPSPQTNVAVAPAPRTNAPARPSTNMVASRPQAAPRTNAQPAAPTVATKPEPPKTNVVAEPLEPVQVVQLSSEPEFKIPVDPTPASRQPEQTAAQTNAVAAAEDPRPLLAPRKEQDGGDGILDRVNPLRLFRRAEKPERSVPPPVRAPDAAPEAAQPAPAPQPRNYPRYAFKPNPAFPKGDRAQAATTFDIGARAHRQRRVTEAIDYYQQAVALDPSYFDGYYNLGVAAYEAGDLPLALSANEQAVALQPTSVPARYNFALALREANYPVDAANQLRELLVEAPDESRAHYALANLYAHELDEPLLAKRHYLRVLELQPNHPEAGAIRAWVASVK